MAGPLTSSAPIAAALASPQLIQHDAHAVRYVPAVRRRNLANVITGQIYSGRVAVAYVQGSAQRRQRLVITQGYEHPAWAGASHQRGVDMKRSIQTAILSLTLAASVPAIAGPYEDFFQASGESVEDGIRSKSPPQVFTSNDLDADFRRLLEDGYILLGGASWTGTPEDAKKTAKFAKKIKATIALVNVKYVETVSGGTQVMMMPIIGGYGGMIGGALPVSFDRYEQTAYFFVKAKPEKIGLGLRFESLTPSQARAVGSGKGISITSVVRGAPAFDAGVIAGDIIMAVAGQDVSTTDRLVRVKADYAGQTVPVEIIRDGQPQTLQITMPAAAPAQAKR